MLGPTAVMALLLAVAAIAAAGGYIASAVARRRKRRARGLFVLGFFCGSLTSAIVREKRRGPYRSAVGQARRLNAVTQRLSERPRVLR
jgi:4-amino-4-deoxy-L-arabinose transferase-like glycosyltransferase